MPTIDGIDYGKTEIAPRRLLAGAARHRSLNAHPDDLPLTGQTLTDHQLTPLATISREPWRALAARSLEPNGYYLADWQAAVNAHARERANVSALSAWTGAPNVGARQLIGLLPVVSLWRAWKIPLPALISADPYGPLGTPLIDGENAEAAIEALMARARTAGARALIIRELPLDGAVMQLFTQVLAKRGMQPRIIQAYRRAELDATQDGEALLRDALGAKKLKELRRQRRRLAEHGEVRFSVARTSEDIPGALEDFLKLEASGWKGERGTALLSHTGDSRFIREAVTTLAARGECEIVTLHAGSQPVAAGVILRDRSRAYFFKMGVAEAFAKQSPGVQLTLDITRHLCDAPGIARADSSAAPDHPMIDAIWRGRLHMGDVLIPLRRHDPITSLIATAATARAAVRRKARDLIHLARKRVSN